MVINILTNQLLLHFHERDYGACFYINPTRTNNYSKTTLDNWIDDGHLSLLFLISSVSQGGF